MRSFLIFLISLMTFSVFFSGQVLAGVDFTGDVSGDFVNGNCIKDSGGNDISTPSGAISGFDIDQICFYYDGLSGQMLVGLTSFEGVIFGDVDGDGDPASSTTGLKDLANMDGAESFVLLFDLDGDSADYGPDADTVDFLVGVPSDASITELGVYRVDSSFDAFTAASGFGALLGGDIGVRLFANPSSTYPDVEFSISQFKNISVKGLEVSGEVYLMAVAGSSAAQGIGFDYLPSAGVTVAQNILDYDEDGLEDWEELDVYSTDPTNSDSDDDGILDGTEVDGANPTDPLDADSDDDDCSDGEEDLNLNGVFEPDSNETDPSVFDTDSDGIGDCTEVTGENPTDPNNDDTDGDNLIDGDEDTNANGSFEPNLDETDPNTPDTDHGGVNDDVERASGTNPNDPSDDDSIAQQSTALIYDQVQGGGFSCALNPDLVRPLGHNWFLVFFGSILLIPLQTRIIKIKSY